MRLIWRMLQEEMQLEFGITVKAQESAWAAISAQYPLCLFIWYLFSIIVLDFVYFEHFIAGNGGNYINGTKSNLQNIINRIIAESSNCFAGESEMYTPSAFGSLKVLQSSYSDVTNGFSCGIFQQIILSSFIYFF